MTEGFARGSLSIAKRDAFLMATNLATGVIIARALGPTWTGVWAIFQILLSYAEAFGRSKMDVAAVYFIGQKRYGLGPVAFTLNVVALASSGLILTLMAIWFDDVYKLLFANVSDVRLLFWLVLLQIPLQFFYLNYGYLHIARSDIPTYNRMVVTRALVSSAFSIVFLLAVRSDLLVVVVGSLLGVLCGLGYGFLKLHRHTRMTARWDWRLVTDMSVYSSKLYVTGVVAALNNQLTSALCALYLLPAQVAYFSLAAARRDIVNIIPNAVSTVLYARISGIREGGDSARFAARTVRTLVPIMLVIGVAAAILAEPAIYLLYGPEFTPVVVPFLLLLPGLLTAGAASAFHPYLMGIGRPGLVVVISIPPILLQAALALRLIPAYGVAGAAVAVSASLVVGAVISLITFLFIARLNVRETLLTRRDDFAALWALVRHELAGSRLRD